METKNNIKKITIVTAYPTQGAGSGTLITAQARTYIELGYDVTIVTANNNTGFDRIPGVKYVLVPFTGEKEPIQKLEGALPFNFVMFTSHTNSSENFDNITISQLEMYCAKFKEIFEQELKENKPDIKGFIISDYEKDYFLIIDENHNIRDIDNTDYTYDNIKSLKIYIILK